MARLTGTRRPSVVVAVALVATVAAAGLRWAPRDGRRDARLRVGAGRRAPGDAVHPRRRRGAGPGERDRSLTSRPRGRTTLRRHVFGSAPSGSRRSPRVVTGPLERPD